MIKKLSAIDVLFGVISLVERNTGLRCYDDLPPKGIDVPFYVVDIVQQEPNPNKLEFREKYTLAIHSFAEGGSSVPVLEMVQELEEAMTERIELPQGYYLRDQVSTGLQPIMSDETGCKHAVNVYDFIICYGYKVKV